jgi:AcrR family transcriptional regulator
MVEVKSRTATPRRTQHERRASTRSALLAAAAGAIVETGPSTGVAEIARRAGVSTGALQYHFESKTDLLVAVVEVGWNDLVERSLAIARDVSPADRVTALVSSMWASCQQPVCRAAFMVSSDPNIDADVAERITPVFDAERSRLDQLWLDTFADLEPPIERVASARRFARSHLVGMVVQRQLTSDEPDPGDELDLLCQATLRILTEQPNHTVLASHTTSHIESSD